MTTFTASEVHRLLSAYENQWIPEELYGEPPLEAKHLMNMLNAYADLLEAQENAVPVVWVSPDDLANPYFVGIGAAKAAHQDLGRHYTQPLYAHPASADAERLAEALREQAAKWLSSMYFGMSDEDEQAVLKACANDVKKVLADHSAQAQPRETMTPRELAKRIERGENWKMVEEPSQAQPPAARVSDEMVERARSAFVKADDGSTGITEAIRAALLAAQETKA